MRDAGLQLSTNGSRVLATFSSNTIRRRQELGTNNSTFGFHGADGLKMEAEVHANTLTTEYLARLQGLAYSFAGSPQSNGQTVFQQSDAWSYTVCNTTIGQAQFFCKIIAEQTGSDSNYEQPYDVPACTAKPTNAAQVLSAALSSSTPSNSIASTVSTSVKSTQSAASASLSV